MLIIFMIIFYAKDIKISYLNKCNFLRSQIKVYFETKVYFTIFDLIFATIISLYKRGKYARQKGA